MINEQHIPTDLERIAPRVAPTAGVDWASTEHAVAVVDPGGIELERFTIADTAPDCGAWWRGCAGPAWRRWRSNAPTDRWSMRYSRPGWGGGDRPEPAEEPPRPVRLGRQQGRRVRRLVLADVLRTDRARLQLLTRDSEATVTLRMTVRARQDLVHTRVAMANQLRAHLQTTLPGVIGLFATSTNDHAAVPDPLPQPGQSRLALAHQARKLARSIGYNHEANLDRLWDDLHEAPRGTTGPAGAARGRETWRWRRR